MTYRTPVSDPFSRMVAFVAVSFIGMVVVFSLSGLLNVWLILAAYLAVMVCLSYFLMKIFSQGLVETVVMNDRMHVRWLKQCLLNKQEDREIAFDYIDEHEYVTSKISNTYTIFLKDGTEFAYNQFNMFGSNKDGLQVMGQDIWEAAERYHVRLAEEEAGIPLGYEKRKVPMPDPNAQRNATLRLVSSVFSVIAIFLFIGFPVLKMAFPQEPLLWDFKVLAAFTGIFLLFAKVFGVVYEKWQKAKGGEEAEENETGYR